MNSLNTEWQNFFRDLFERVGGAQAPTNNDLVEKEGSITQLDYRSHSDMQDLDSDDHTIYLKGRVGTGTFNSTSGVTIDIGETLTSADYRVIITPTTADPSTIGAISIYNRTTSTFDVYNSGADSASSFDWIIVER